MPEAVDLSKTEGFDWDKANISHIARHNVDSKEAEEVFFNANQQFAKDKKHSNVESRFSILGKTNQDRRLKVVFTVRKRKIRVVSSRDMSKKERRLYEKET